MVSFKSFIVTYGLTLLPVLVRGSPIVPHYFKRDSSSPSNVTSDVVQAELGAQLSNGTVIFGPDNPKWDSATSKWNTRVKPDVKVVVQPAAESDVAKIIKYCNTNSFEFLVRNRGHGTPFSLSDFSGIEIDMAQLGGLTIQPDGETAIFQGGIYGAEVVQTLWDAGYVTTTGSVLCVGLLGPALGGGHSRYEGLYGMVMDTILHYNVVLANGTEIGVNETSHSDLLWALKGAGHNFAAVTSIVKKIHPRENWHYHTYTWTQDKLEQVFETLNTYGKSYNGTKPPRMGVSHGSIIMNKAISETEAVLEWGFQYAGPADEAEELLAPFNAIGAVAEDMGDVPYPVLFGDAAGDCPAAQRAISHTMTVEYNVTTERALYNHFNAKVAEYPEITANLLHEGYATAGYQAIPSDSTAYPHREENYILAFFSEIPQGSEADLLEAAETWAKESQEIWNAGQPGRPTKTYVNYVQGESNDWETLESIYGYEPWRLDRLRSLKATYDPENRFGFYAPIISDSA